MMALATAFEFRAYATQKSKSRRPRSRKETGREEAILRALGLGLGQITSRWLRFISGRACLHPADLGHYLRVHGGHAAHRRPARLEQGRIWSADPRHQIQIAGLHPPQARGRRRFPRPAW